MIVIKCCNHRYTREIPHLEYHPCNGIVSCGAQIGGLRVFADHSYENKSEKSAPTIFTHRAAFYAILSSRSDRSRCRWHTHQRTMVILITRKTWRPQFEPHAGMKMAQVLLSPLYICGYSRGCTWNDTHIHDNITIRLHTIEIVCVSDVACRHDDL